MIKMNGSLELDWEGMAQVIEVTGREIHPGYGLPATAGNASLRAAA